MSSRTVSTTDHSEIMAWVERHGGIPCRVRGGGADGLPVLRIDFPNRYEELEPLDWEQWFVQFDQARMAFLYRLERADVAGAGAFAKLIRR